MDIRCCKCKINMLDYHKPSDHGDPMSCCDNCGYQSLTVYDYNCATLTEYVSKYCLQRYNGSALCLTCFFDIESEIYKLQDRHSGVISYFNSRLDVFHTKRINNLSNYITVHKNLNVLIAEYAIE
jgi:hypothetical protein